MYFKRLDMHGFKSFAEPVSMEFTDGMTCIVGPNGSGKSNVADAIKWALGEQSPKNLRGGKMEEVIFAGTENRKARGIAEVTLVIDNKDGILPIEYNEVAIARKMYRSGESEYLINGHSCRLKDIKELIMDTGMGVEGYSMIGQGKIADIVNNKADGRRELFESAAGISKYRVRKLEAEKKLANSSSNLERVNDIISEIEGRIDGLKEDSAKAEEYLVLSSKYKQTEINLAVRQAENIEERVKIIKDEIEGSEKRILEFSREKENCDSQLEEIRSKSIEADARLESERENLIKELEQINSLKKNVEVSQERLSSAEREFDANEEELKKNKIRTEEQEKNLESFEQRKQSLENDEEKIKSELGLKEMEYAAASEEASCKLAEIEKKKSDVLQLHSGISIGETEISGLNALVEGLEKRRSKLSEDLTHSEAVIAELDNNIELSEAQLSKNSEIRTETAEQLDRLRKNIGEIKQNYTELIKAREAVENRKHKALTKRDLLQGFENSYEGFAYAVKFIMGNSSRLRGIHGVVSELIDVPKGYEIAVQTALGGGMQNIVCDNDKAAADAVELLKRERAGRATFLPIGSIRGGKNAAAGQDADRLRTEKGFLGFAAEIVKYDAKYAKIAEYLLGRTVITDNIESAVRLSKIYRSGIRFVTLEGDDINPSGAITGGRMKNSGPNIFERKNEIKTLTDEIADLTGESEKLSQEAQKADTEIRRESENEAELENLLKSKESSLVNIKSDADMLKAQKASLQENIKRWKRETEDINRESEETRGMIADIRSKIANKMSEIKAGEGVVDEEIKAYESSKAFADSLVEEINQLKIKLSSLISDKRFSEENIRKSRIEIENIKNEMSQREKRSLELRASRDEAAKNIELFQSELKLAEENHNKINASSAQTKAERDELNAQKNEMEKYSRELETRINAEKSGCHEAELKFAKSEAQLEAIKNRLWDTFEVSFVEAQSMKIDGFSASAAQRESRELKNRMRELEPVNIGAIEEYKQVSERYRFMSEQRADLTAAIESLNGIIKDMDRNINLRFMKSFEEISAEFKVAFEELFGGGTAELRLENTENILECVVEIIAQPPGKKLQNINLLSGGEKSLTAIALLCAILKVKPTPFCILDEVEAALDDLNIGRFVDYIRKFSNVQFIVVTHQKVTMEKANVIYGITMPEKGVSKVISLKMNQEAVV